MVMIRIMCTAAAAAAAYDDDVRSINKQTI